MKESVRNIAVGVTCIVALALLGGMIVIFTGVPGALRWGYRVRVRFDATHDITEGDSVYLAGIRVGRVTDVGFTVPENPAMGVTITANIDQAINIPSNAKAIVFTKGFVGKGYLSLIPEGPIQVDERTGRPIPFLPKDDSVVLVGEHRGSGLLPKELDKAMTELAKLAANLNKLITPAPATAPGSGPSGLGGLQETLAKLNRTLDAIHTVIGDPENRANISESMANIRRAADRAAEAMEALRDFADRARQAVENVSTSASSAAERVNRLAAKLMEDTDEISRLLVAIRQIVAKVDSQQGTAGRLLNDPELYENLTEATRQMGELMGEFRRLLEAWKETGVEIRLK